MRGILSFMVAISLMPGTAVAQSLADGRAVQMIEMGNPLRFHPGQGRGTIATGARKIEGSSPPSFQIYLVGQPEAQQLPVSEAPTVNTQGEGMDARPPQTAIAAIEIPLWMRSGSVNLPFSSDACSHVAYRPSGLLDAEAERRRATHFGIMRDVACQYGIPVGLFDAMIISESQYDPFVVSPKGAFGLTQLMPLTAAELGVDRYDRLGNLRGGARYLRAQLDRYGAYHLALAAYNAGPGRIRKGAVPQIGETRRYVAQTLANWDRLVGRQEHGLITVTQPPQSVRRRIATVTSF